MTGAGSKQKGSRFELLVAKRILEAVGKPFTKADCYRTPQSGGHRFAGKGDLKISPELLRIFPFSVECKHRNGIKLGQFFDLTSDLYEFHVQCCKSAALEQLLPLLVIRPTAGAIYVAGRREDLFKYDQRLVRQALGLDYLYHVAHCEAGKQWWRLVQLEQMLAVLSDKAAKLRDGKPVPQAA